MLDFKVKVTPEQSRIVQETLFKLGYKWFSGATIVKHTRKPVLHISLIDKDITYLSSDNVSSMTFETFEKMFIKKKEPMEKELKITKERVLEAANSCAQAKEVLKKIFPEVFEDDKYLNVPPFIHGKKQILYTKEGEDIIWPSLSGNFRERGFYLISRYDWDIVIDDEGGKILVPTKKQ